MNEPAPKIGLEEINEKLDRLLTYQRVSFVWGIIKVMIWLAVIGVIFVLPFYFIYQFIQNPFAYIDPSQFPPEIKQMIEEAIKNSTRQ